MKRTTTILATLALGVVSATAGVEPVYTGKGVAQPPPPMDPCAGPISYNNVELLYANTDYDGYGDSSDGGIIRVEYSPMTNLYFAASGQYTDYDSGNIWTLTAGIGGYLPLTENIHIAGDAGIVYADWEYDYIYNIPTKGNQETRSYGDSDTGWYVRPHLRAKWGCLTVHAGAVYTDISESEDWSWFLNAYYQITQSWDITAGISDGGDSDSQTLTVGARWRY